jgi:hypothetical protein
MNIVANIPKKCSKRNPQFMKYPVKVEFVQEISFCFSWKQLNTVIHQTGQRGVLYKINIWYNSLHLCDQKSEQARNTMGYSTRYVTFLLDLRPT